MLIKLRRVVVLFWCLLARADQDQEQGCCCSRCCIWRSHPQSIGFWCQKQAPKQSWLQHCTIRGTLRSRWQHSMHVCVCACGGRATCAPAHARALHCSLRRSSGHTTVVAYQLGLPRGVHGVRVFTPLVSGVVSVCARAHVCSNPTRDSLIVGRERCMLYLFRSLQRSSSRPSRGAHLGCPYLLTRRPPGSRSRAPPPRCRLWKMSTSV